MKFFDSKYDSEKARAIRPLPSLNGCIDIISSCKIKNFANIAPGLSSA